MSNRRYERGLSNKFVELLIVFGFLMLVVPSVHAKSTYTAIWSSLYPSSSSDSNARCALCHISIVGGGLNSCGVAQANSIAGL